LSISTVLPSNVEQVQSVNATKLRDLDAFEEFFWLAEQSVSVFHAVVVQVNGATTIEQWKNALDAIQIRYPLLSASIGKVPGKRPFFEKRPGVSMALRIAPLKDSLLLEEEMEKELHKPFGDGSGPLTRATLFHGQDRSVVMFATHHSSKDGMSHLLLIQDLLAHVAGEELGGLLPVQPGFGQLLGFPSPAEYLKTLEGKSVAPDDATQIEMPKISVRRLQLSMEETATLQQRAREQGTTVHAALIAALTLAGKKNSEKWNTQPVRCMSPIDMRKMLNTPDVPGLLISAHHSAIPTPDDASLWDIARAVREDMLPARSINGAQQLISGLSSMVAEEHDARDFYWNIMNSPLLHELMVTNYAGYKVRTNYGNLKIENLFTGSTSLGPELQKVSVLTVNGRLGMTLVNRDVLPNLLEDAREILIRA
jgi:NRPS condensation-like uncharacterized protein